MSTSPYPGLRPFHRDEADIFFGRDEQVEQLLIRLGKSRFLAVVGPSGCGKSSLVHTGLLNALEAGFLADVGLHWRIATMQPGSHPMRTLATVLVEHIGSDTDSGFSCPLPSGKACPEQCRRGRGEGFQKSTNSNPPSESHVTAFSDTGTSIANETPQHDDTAFLLATLRRGPLGLIEALREQPLPENTNLLLVVDQFEEIFRYRELQDRDEADAFVALLLRSVQYSTFPVYIVITMRSDFLGDCALFPGLPEALNDSQFLTPRLNREQRRLAITGPARVCGGDVEPALVNRLLNDMGADPDQLPVLQHALMRLWTDAAKRDNKPLVLKLDDYDALGGWDNTLSNHADEAFKELDKPQQTIAEIMFRALTERTGARRDTRRPVSLQTVAGIAGVGIEQVIPVIEVFRRADRSFVMPPEGWMLTAETLIDISHESLIRQWQRMKEWVEREAQSADTYRRLEQTALLHSQKRADLLQGLDLFPVLAWKKREQPTTEWAARYGKDFTRTMRFLTASQRRQRRKSILKIFVFAAICLTAAGMTWLWHQADTERHKAAGARLLAAGQLQRSQDLWNPLGILLGVEAMKHYPHAYLELNQFQLTSLGMLPMPNALLQHSGKVYRVVFRPDGKQLATASRDNTARLWDAATGRELQRLNHDDRVYAVSFSPDGKQLATASYDKTARLWDAATGQELQRLNHDGRVYSTDFSADGKQLATASDDKTARLWDTATGRELQHLRHDGKVNAVTFSPDGKQLATASDDQSARLWNAVSGKELQRLKHDGNVNAVTFSPDGKQLATASNDKFSRLWDAATGNELQRLNHEGSVDAVSFSPDGKQLATASNDKTSRLWDPVTGRELQRLSHDDAVYTVNFSPGGKQLASASWDSTARLWDTATGKELKRLSHDGRVYDVTFSPDGRQLASASWDMTARLWDAVTGPELLRLNHDDLVTAVTFSPDGKQLATVSGDKLARLWDAATGRELQRLNHDGRVDIVTFSPDGKQLATASWDMTARLWDTATGRELQRLKHDETVYAVAFSTDGKQITTASGDKLARLWDAATGRELQRLRHNDAVIAVTFSPSGKQLATASADKTARLWDAATGRELQNQRHNDAVIAVAFSPSGKLLATASADKTARLWDVATGQELQRLNHDDLVTTVAFSPDGKQLVTANGHHFYNVSGGNTALLWDVATGRELQRLRHDGHVYAVIFSPDGKQLATTSDDKTARLWDAATGKEVQRLNHDGRVNAVAFSPDGKRLASGSDDNTARLWLWQPEDLVKQLCSRLLHNMTWDDWQKYFEDEPYRKTCERLPVASKYQENGKQLLRQGKTVEAVRMIQQLNAADPALKLDLEKTLGNWRAYVGLEEAEQLLKMKKITEAIAAFNRVEQMDSKVISAKSWNALCWYGALGGQSARVLDACEKAVLTALAEERPMYQDSRGFARALTGNSQGAIEDFGFVINNTGDENIKKQRQTWIQALRAGHDPFTKEELAKLQNQ